jgi:hypothetical protein
MAASEQANVTTDRCHIEMKAGMLKILSSQISLCMSTCALAKFSSKLDRI